MKSERRVDEAAGVILGRVAVELFVDGLPEGAASLERAFAVARRRLLERARRLGADTLVGCTYEFWTVGPASQRRPARSVEVHVRGVAVRRGQPEVAHPASAPEAAARV